jgi:hypothetical protein
MTKSVNTKPVNAKPAFNLNSVMQELAESQALKDTCTLGLSNAQESIQACYRVLVENKVVMGKSVRTCAVAQSFRDSLESIIVHGKAKYAAGTITNYISALRIALLTRPKVLDLNVSQTAKRAKAKEENATKGTSTKNGVNPKDTKAGKVSTTTAPVPELTATDAILLDLKNAMAKMRSIEDAKFDVPVATKVLQGLITTIELGKKPA